MCSVCKKKKIVYMQRAFMKLNLKVIFLIIARLKLSCRDFGVLNVQQFGQDSKPILSSKS